MMWIIVANSFSCRIFSYTHKPTQALTIIKEMIHPETKLKATELTSDKPGHYKTSGTSHGAFQDHETPHQLAIENFAREIATTLNTSRHKQSYTQLIMIAPPHMLGAIRLHLENHVKNTIIKEINKDYNKVADHELLAILKNEM